MIHGLAEHFKKIGKQHRFSDWTDGCIAVTNQEIEEIWRLVPEFLAIGVDILDPIQTMAKGMEPERLKRDFGEKITLWGGGCDTRWVLPHGTPQQVREHVREQVRMIVSGQLPPSA